MTTIGSPPREPRNWDVPLQQVADQMRGLKAKATAEERQALLDEQRHQLLDLDPDSAFTLPGCTCVNCPPKTTGGTA